MLTEDQYKVIKGYEPMIDMYVNHGTYVGGADPLFDYLEQQGISGGQPITRNCTDCTAGFLKFTKSMINLYENNMKKYKISYYYYASGMENGADTRPEEVIEALNEDQAIYRYVHKHFDGYKNTSFEDFMTQNPTHRTWGISIKKIE